MMYMSIIPLMSSIGGGDHERDMELCVVPMTVKFWGKSAGAIVTRDEYIMIRGTY